MAFKIQYQREAVTPAFRKWLLTRFNVKSNSPEWRFVCYAVLGSHDNGLLSLPKEAMAGFDGVTDPYRIRFKYYLYDRLREIQARFPELQIDWIEGTQGWVTRLSRVLPADVQEQIDKELETCLSESTKVYLESGKAINERNKTERRKEQLEEIAVLNKINRPEGGNQDETLILSYLNGLPPHHFTKLITKGKLEKALKQAQEREKVILEKIWLQPQQLYYHGENTCRLVPYRQGIASLKSEIRRELTEDWLEVDLKNAGLAINAKLWDIEEAQHFLQGGTSWWDELFDWFKIKPDKTIRKACKERTYALSYGMAEATIREGRDFDYPLAPEYVDKLFEHPVVAAIMKRRDEKIAEVAKQNGAFDAYGRWIELETPQWKLKKKRTTEITETSVLAQVNQSYEQVLIAEAFRFAEQYKDDFTITLYQSDGFSLAVRDRTRAEYWFNRINTEVKRKAEELEIHTELAK